MPEDIHEDELIRRMEAVLALHPHAEVFVKWTCPKCGERVMSGEANTYHSAGYLHEDCGFLYTGKFFGFMAAFHAIDEP